MSDKKTSIFSTINSFNKTFWLASFMELMERWAWYGIFTLFGLYLVGSTDEGGLGFNHIQKGNIMANVTAILYFLPIFFGVIADRIGYKLSLVIAYIIMIVGYYFMGEVNTYWSMYMIFLLVAIGAAFFKPVASAIVARNTDETTGTMGFGIFYMMVNIGGFVGPWCSSYLRTEFGWKIIFIQAAIVIGINLLMVLIFYKEPEVEKKHKEPILKEIKVSLLNIVEALKDKRLTILLILMIGFWTMFNQLFYTLPNFIEDWVNSAQISNWINQNLPFLGKTLTQDGQVKPEWFTNIDALMIILFQVSVSFFVIKMRHINAIIRGSIIATIGVSLTFFTHNVWFTVIGTMIFAIGEMMSSPTLSSFIALITPKGKEGLYQGTYFLPVAAGNFFTGFIAGDLYQKWSDKLSLLQTELGKRNIAMPEVVSKEEFIEQGSKALNLSISDFEKQFHLKDANLDYATIGENFKTVAAQKGIDVSGIQTPFSKSEYFALAEQKLNLNHWQMTDMLWENYQPNKIWFVVCAVGLVSIVSLIIYDRFVVRPLEKKSAAL
ncbi:MFS transporter [Flavobacterium sp. NST-5]|uniref:MFS transporter n=1 Tax=Flavobacterium ichthyis TaxID=2698827 RepID=A0ABW9Z6W5_9FLAO|nr:MFS transporter [Flavobacterium ichthyis]NBL64585.1 MFS transporter [Flavobacterium ichthyis]